MNTGTEIQAFEPRTLEEAQKLCGTLAKSPLMPDALRGKEVDVLIIMMTGRELGLSAMQSLRSISVIKGKPALSADLMVALCKKRSDICEYLVLTEATDKVATYKAKHVGEPETTMSFTMQDAVAAGLTTSDMYRKYPKQMLRARCASMICRAIFPELTMGLYDSDSGELTDGVVPMPTPAAPAVQAKAPPAPAKLERATEDAATEPPPGIALPAGPPAPNTEAFDRHFEAELRKAPDAKALQRVAASGKGKVLNKAAMDGVYLACKRDLSNAGAH